MALRAAAGFCLMRRCSFLASPEVTAMLGGHEGAMAYQFDFFRHTRDTPEGKTVRRHIEDFADLQEARAYGISELRVENLAVEMDGCRIYCDGVYKSTVSIHSEARDVPTR